MGGPRAVYGRGHAIAQLSAAALTHQFEFLKQTVWLARLSWKSPHVTKSGDFYSIKPPKFDRQNWSHHIGNKKIKYERSNCLSWEVKKQTASEINNNWVASTQIVIFLVFTRRIQKVLWTERTLLILAGGQAAWTFGIPHPRSSCLPSSWFFWMSKITSSH